jgi:hypothetical protein
MCQGWAFPAVYVWVGIKCLTLVLHRSFRPGGVA